MSLCQQIKRLTSLKQEFYRCSGECLPSPIDDVGDVDELVVVSVRHDDGVIGGVLLDQGGGEVEEGPVDEPLGPHGSGAAAKQGGVAGIAVPAQVLVDQADIRAFGWWHIHLDGTEIMIESWNGILD